MSEIIVQTTRAAARSLRGLTFWAVVAGASIVCFLSGPFGTLEALPNGFRFIYWALIVFTTGALALWGHALIHVQKWRDLSKLSLVSLIFGLLVAGFVVVLSIALLNPIERYPGHFDLFLYSFPTATIIFMISALLEISSKPTANDAAETVVRPDLFGRLAKHGNARRILSLVAKDHYVEVTTEKGSELCLMRLNDAISEAAPEEGLQVHRSHWIAKSAVEAFEVKGANGQVRLTDGRVLSVSQSRLKDVEAFLQSVSI